jgi:thioesterase domain-containing protein
MNPVEYPRTMISSMSWLRSSTAYHISKLRRMRANEILPYIQERMKTMRASAALRSRRGANLQDSYELKNIVTMVEVAVMNYQPQPYAGRVTYFERGENPPLADDPTHGWGPLMKGEFRPHRIPGKHAEMFQSPNVELMAAKINELLG